MVDLPGYGYAKMSKSSNMKFWTCWPSTWARARVYTPCQLFDLRHQPTAEDREVFQTLSMRGFQVIIVATKADKLALSKRKPARNRLAKALGVEMRQVVLPLQRLISVDKTFWPKSGRHVWRIDEDASEPLLCVWMAFRSLRNQQE